MQKRGRALIETRFDKKRMLAEYQGVYQEAAKKPRRAPKKPGVWMHLAMLAQFWAAKNMREALPELSVFLEDTRSIEPYFLRHPMGNSCVAFILNAICPALLDEGYPPVVAELCKKFRKSRCMGPELDSIEKKMSGMH